MIDLEHASVDIFQTAMANGFWHLDEGEEFPFYAYKLAMIHSEATEVLEAIRKDKGQHEVVEEIADILIRTLDLYIGLKQFGEIDPDLSLEKVLADKVEYNKTRPVKHGVRG